MSSGGRRGLHCPETRRLWPKTVCASSTCPTPRASSSLALGSFTSWTHTCTGTLVLLSAMWGSDCLAIRYAAWERAYQAGWCISEQFWNVVKAFDMLSHKPQLALRAVAPPQVCGAQAQARFILCGFKSRGRRSCCTSTNERPASYLGF